MWAGFVGELYPDVPPPESKRTFLLPQTSTSRTFEGVSEVLTPTVIFCMSVKIALATK